MCTRCRQEVIWIALMCWAFASFRRAVGVMPSHRSFPEPQMQMLLRTSAYLVFMALCRYLKVCVVVEVAMQNEIPMAG